MIREMAFDYPPGCEFDEVNVRWSEEAERAIDAELAKESRYTLTEAGIQALRESKLGGGVKAGEGCE